MVKNILLIDNYDSYTFNLYQLIAAVNGGPPTVVRNDCEGQEQLLQQLRGGHYHSVVISPGPGTPHSPADIGLCAAVLEAAVDVPVLGVCLGMQALAVAHGARVSHAPEAVHGRLSDVLHTHHPLFRGIPSGVGAGFEVVRYHSLAVEEASLPTCLQPIAWTCGRHHALERAEHGTAEALACASAGVAPVDGRMPCTEAATAGVLMAVAHRARPHFGVQFHPESIATKFGATLLHNFRLLADAHHGQSSLPSPAYPPGSPGCSHPPRPWSATDSEAPLQVSWRRLPGQLSGTGGSEHLFCSLYGSHAAQDTFWLDSSDSDRGRFSFMGGAGGPLWQRVTYWLPQHEALPQRSASQSSLSAGGKLVLEDSAGAVSSTTGTHFFDWLEQQLMNRRCRRPAETAAGLPFDFWGGFVGYLGYELKAECGAASSHAAPTPDAAFFLADRIVVADHRMDDVYLVALHTADDAEAKAAAEAWVDGTVTAITAMQQCVCGQHDSSKEAQVSSAQAGASQRAADSRKAGCASCESSINGVDMRSGHLCGSTSIDEAPLFVLRHAREQYMEDVRLCLKALYDGESYELCLTTALECQLLVDAFELYRTLRRLNPAPYAAWLSFSGGPQICCSSPERFLSGGRGGLLEARPIKGTASRVHGDIAADAAAARALLASEKDRAENLMIVDLLRNDLGRVCQVGSVHVAGLMELESFATVHQLVSTVRGLRCPTSSVVDCLRAAFPGGSMTGAPKLRSMAILERLEGAPRGPYSGALGYIALNDTFDLNIVIRTAVVYEAGVSIGAGGAVVVQSDPAGEFEEMELKAAPIVKAVQLAFEKRAGLKRT